MGAGPGGAGQAPPPPHPWGLGTTWGACSPVGWNSRCPRDDWLITHPSRLPPTSCPLCAAFPGIPGSHRLGGTCLDKPAGGSLSPAVGIGTHWAVLGILGPPCSPGVLQAGPVSPLGTRQRQGQTGSPSQFACRSPSCSPLSWWGAGAGGGCPGRERLGVSHAGLREALPLLLGSLVIPLSR